MLIFSSVGMYQPPFCSNVFQKLEVILVVDERPFVLVVPKVCSVMHLSSQTQETGYSR